MQPHHPFPLQASLPLHLMLVMTPWLASLSALGQSKSGLRGSNVMPPNLPPAAANLSDAWQQLAREPMLARAVEKEARKRAAGFLDGLQQYRQIPLTRDVEEPEALFAIGSAVLRGYGAREGAVNLLLIPSLINRYTILDLTQRMSFARYLRAQGYNVFVADWGIPLEEEAYLDGALYVTERLVPLAEWIRRHHKGALVPVGYCMGGILALAMAAIRPDLADAAAFLATPWDFHAAEFPRFALRDAEIQAVETALAHRATVPPEIIDILFHCANPYAFPDKFRAFARMDKNHAATEDFLAVQHWLNDGVPMTRGIARDCLIAWTQHNAPFKGNWNVGGHPVIPGKLQMPCFAAVPRNDRIVPETCALPLAGLLRDVTLVRPSSGHIGMMTGSRRKAGLWEPFVKWLESGAKL